MQLAYALLSVAGLLAWLVIPSALAGLAMHAHEARRRDRAAVEASRLDRARRHHSNMAL